MYEVLPLSGTKLVLLPLPLTDAMGFPTFPLSVDIPLRAYPDRPGTADPVALLHWIADIAERDGVETIGLGGIHG
jgi:hypothetical protein